MARVLAIDDVASVLEYVEGVLTGAGHQVVTATNAKSGLEILAATPVDVVITDIYMPGEDGLHVIRQAKMLRPDLPIIAMSAKTGHWSMMKVAKALGACASLPKPFTDRRLIDTIARVCSK